MINGFQDNPRLSTIPEFIGFQALRAGKPPRFRSIAYCFPLKPGQDFSRRSSSRSTASRMKSDRFSLSANTPSMRASVPAGKRPGVCSSLIFGLPTGRRVSDITFSAKACILLISPIDPQSDITYVDDIRYGVNEMITKTKINAARAYGSIAFAKGAVCAPAADRDCMSLLVGEPVGRAGVKILKAWMSGWTQACLAA